MDVDNTLIKKFYELHLQKYGKDDIRAMGWFEEQEYSVRFEIAANDLDLNNASILDVGCGFGGLYQHLITKFSHFSYLGIDVVPKMIEIAQQKNPNVHCKVGDILNDNFGTFDYVFCIGTLNITSPNYSDYFYDMVRKMISRAKKAVILNFLSDQSHLIKGSYHFEDPKKLKEHFENENIIIEIKEDERVLGESFVIIKIR